MPLHPTLHSFTYALDYLREQLTDIPDEQMTVQPSGIASHPAWIVGHLTFTCQMIGRVVGLTPWLPADAMERFGTGSVPVADRAAYPPKPQALAALADAQDRLTRAVQQFDPTRLDEPFPDPAYADVFPSIRHALTQVLVGHMSFHVGQVSIWRRAMSLPRMQRGFE
jgi:hypothetical protein